MKSKHFISFWVCVLCLSLLASCGGKKDTKRKEPEILNASPKFGEIVPLLEGPIYDWITNYGGPGSSDAYTTVSTDLFAPKPLTITWEEEPGTQYYTVTLSRNSDLSEADTYVTFDNYLIVEDLFSGTGYYYTVTACKEDEQIVSELYDFRTAELPRTISLAGISNTRDMGGYLAEGGTKRIRQGIVYRGAELDGKNRNDLVEAFIYRYGIKTELDLRNGTEVSPIKKYLNFIRVKAPYYTNINNPEYAGSIATEVRTFASAENYPIYFHCSLGRDRTGTLAMILEALLGVSEHDIYLDYELSHFSARGNNGDADAYVTTNNLRWLIMYFTNYGPGTLSENVAEYLLAQGLTQEELDAIKANMLEEVR